MTDQQKETIRELHAQGLGYKSIAKQTGLPVGSITTFFYRERHKKIGVRCLYCDKKMVQTKGHRPKTFCSVECRTAWWREHPDKHKNEKAYYASTCAYCHKEFKAYGNNHRKFCSRECYRNSFKGGERHD